MLGPGSLYTSVIPNLLVDGVAEAISQSDALKIYVCNIMTQDGETEDMTAADHVEALMEHGLGNLDICLCNNATVAPELLERYREEDARPIVIDHDRLARLGVEVVERPVDHPRGRAVCPPRAGAVGQGGAGALPGAGPHPYFLRADKDHFKREDVSAMTFPRGEGGALPGQADQKMLRGGGVLRHPSLLQQLDKP